MEEEEAGEAEAADRRQLVLEPSLGLVPAARARVALGEQGAAGLGQLAVGAAVAFARVAIAELGGEVELSRSARRRVSATASGCSAKRAAIARGEASAEVGLPRRCGSDSSSVMPSRTATSASCRWARRRACEWTLPVASAGHAEPLRRVRASQRFRARSRRQ